MNVRDLFPKEIWEKILAYGTVRDRSALALTCRSMYWFLRPGIYKYQLEHTYGCIGRDVVDKNVILDEFMCRNRNNPIIVVQCRGRRNTCIIRVERSWYVSPSKFISMLGSFPDFDDMPSDITKCVWRCEQVSKQLYHVYDEDMSRSVYTNIDRSVLFNLLAPMHHSYNFIILARCVVIIFVLRAHSPSEATFFMDTICAYGRKSIGDVFDEFIRKYDVPNTYCKVDNTLARRINVMSRGTTIENIDKFVTTRAEIILSYALSTPGFMDKPRKFVAD